MRMLTSRMRLLLVAVVAAVAMPAVVFAANPDIVNPPAFGGCDWQGYTYVSSDSFSQTGQEPFLYCTDFMIANGYFWNGSSYILRSSGWVDGSMYGATSMPYFGTSTQAYGYHQIIVNSSMSQTYETFAS